MRIPELPVTETLNDNASMAVDEIGQPTKSIKIDKMKEIFGADNVHTVDYKSNIVAGEQVVLCTLKANSDELRSKYAQQSEAREVAFNITLLIDGNLSSSTSYQPMSLHIGGDYYLSRLDDPYNVNTNISSVDLHTPSGVTPNQTNIVFNMINETVSENGDLEFEVALSDIFKDNGGDDRISVISYTVQLLDLEDLEVVHGDGRLSSVVTDTPNYVEITERGMYYDADNNKWTAGYQGRIAVGDAIDDEDAVNKGQLLTPNITSQASESWNGVDEPLSTWQANAKVLIDGNANAIDGLATASMEYIYNGDLSLTTVEQKIPIVTLLPSSNADIMSIDDVNHQASLLVDSRYSYYTYLSVENSSQQDHIMHLITRTSGGVLLTDRELTIPKEGVELLLLELEVVDITGTPLIFELFATADDINDLKITYLKSHISAGGEALVSSYVKKDGSTPITQPQKGVAGVDADDFATVGQVVTIIPYGDGVLRDSDFPTSNTEYIITHDFTIEETGLTLPNETILNFSGGSINGSAVLKTYIITNPDGLSYSEVLDTPSTYVLTCENTTIKNGYSNCINGVILEGSVIGKCSDLWFNSSDDIIFENILKFDVAELNKSTYTLLNDYKRWTDKDFTLYSNVNTYIYTDFYKIGGWFIRFKDDTTVNISNIFLENKNDDTVAIGYNYRYEVLLGYNINMKVKNVKMISGGCCIKTLNSKATDFFEADSVDIITNDFAIELWANDTEDACIKDIVIRNSNVRAYTAKSWASSLSIVNYQPVTFTNSIIIENNVIRSGSPEIVGRHSVVIKNNETYNSFGLESFTSLEGHRNDTVSIINNTAYDVKTTYYNHIKYCNSCIVTGNNLFVEFVDEYTDNLVIVDVEDIRDLIMTNNNFFIDLNNSLGGDPYYLLVQEDVVGVIENNSFTCYSPMTKTVNFNVSTDNKNLLLYNNRYTGAIGFLDIGKKEVDVLGGVFRETKSIELLDNTNFGFENNAIILGNDTISLNPSNYMQDHIVIDIDFIFLDGSNTLSLIYLFDTTTVNILIKNDGIYIYYDGSLYQKLNLSVSDYNYGVNNFKISLLNGRTISNYRLNEQQSNNLYMSDNADIYANSFDFSHTTLDFTINNDSGGGGGFGFISSKLILSAF